eukprot:326405-Pyramimonas_sp.AAC.1
MKNVAAPLSPRADTSACAIIAIRANLGYSTATSCSAQRRLSHRPRRALSHACTRARSRTRAAQTTPAEQSSGKHQQAGYCRQC